MLEFKIKLILSIITFIWLVDVYSWQAVKTILIRKYSNRIKSWKRSYFSIPVVVSLLFLATFFIPSLETNMVYRTYVSSLIFVVYLSKFLLCLFLLIDDLLRLIKWVISKIRPSKKQYSGEHTQTISRAKFISQAGAITAGVPLVMLTKGIFKGAYDYQIHRVPLYLKNLPKAFEGVRLIQFSDIHTGSLFDKDSVHKGIQLAMNEKPDLIFFTGDLVNNHTDEAYPLMDHFSQLKAPMGVFSIFGNHDYGDYIQWSSKEAKQKNLADLVQVHKKMGWQLLRNEHIILEREGQKIGILGVENWGDKGRFQKFGDMDKAKQGIQDVPVKLLLSHDPSHFDSIVSKQHKDIAATFSGHTHGFQFGIENSLIKWSPSQYIYPRWAGLYAEGEQQLYVNRGFGFLGYPGRVGILPEITVFELRRG